MDRLLFPLAAALGPHSLVLMRGHGSTVVGASLEQAVYRAIYAETNARLQSQAIALGEANVVVAGGTEQAWIGGRRFSPLAGDLRRVSPLGGVTGPHVRELTVALHWPCNFRLSLKAPEYMP